MTAPGGTSEQAIVVKILADIQGLLTGMKESTSAVSAATTSMKGSLEALEATAKSLLGPFALLFAAVQGFGELKEAIEHTTEMAVQLEVLHQKTGIAVEQLSALRYVAELSHVSMDQFGIAIGRLARNMEQAARGGAGPAAQSFKDLRISVTDTHGHLRPLLDVLFAVADRFHTMEDGAKKTATAINLLGRSGANLIPMLNQGRAGIQALEEQARHLGIVLTQENVESILEYHRAMIQLHAAWGGFVLLLSQGVIPILEGLARFLTAVLDVVRALGNAILLLIDILTLDFSHATEDAKGALERLKDAWKAMSEKAPAPAEHKGGDNPPVRETISLMEKFQLELDQLRRNDLETKDRQIKQELDFWNAKLAIVSASSKEYIQIFHTITGLEQQLAQQQYDAKMAGLKVTEEVDKKDLALVVKDRDKQLKLIKAFYGAASKEYQEGLLRIQQAKDALTEHDTKQWEHVFDGIGRSFSNVINEMKQSGGSFRDFMRNILKEMVIDFALAELSILKAHIARWLAEKGITAQGVAVKVAMEAWGALKVIAMKAAEAAAGAWAAISGIPFVGPFLAPAAAAATLAGVLALAGGIKSAAGGYDIPAGLNPIVQTHAREMILPAHLADAVRDMAAGGRGGGGGEIHLHVHAQDSADVARFMMKHKGAVAAAAHAAAQGGKGFKSQPGRRA